MPLDKAFISVVQAQVSNAPLTFTLYDYKINPQTKVQEVFAEHHLKNVKITAIDVSSSDENGPSTVTIEHSFSEMELTVEKFYSINNQY